MMCCVPFLGSCHSAGQDEDRHAANGCSVGTLHTCAGELALAALLESVASTARAVAALEQLGVELERVLGDRPSVS